MLLRCLAVAALLCAASCDAGPIGNPIGAPARGAGSASSPIIVPTSERPSDVDRGPVDGSPRGAGTISYDIDVQIRYDVSADGVTYPDTPVWGMPAGAPLSSGTLELVVDGAGNVSGASPVDPITGLGMLRGQRLYALHNATFRLSGGSWGTPADDVAPITAGTVDLGDTLIGDFTDLNTVTGGFIKDGNSGNSFDLTNGVGLDGKLEFTLTGTNGMSMTFNSKNWGGVGTGWYTFAMDVGEIAYSHGTDTAATGLTGVVSYDVYIDATARTFLIPEQILLEDFPALWQALGKRIDNFSGIIDPAGNFVGTAHFAGIDFTSLTGVTTDGTFEDGNSPGFDIGDGLAPGDTFTAVLTDSTGRFDLVIDGTLLSQDGGLLSAAPAHRRRLGRTANNTARLTFHNTDLIAPAPGEILIQELLPDGARGPDLSSGFSFSVENDAGGNPRVLRIREDGSVLTDRTWYGIRNTGGWSSASNFEVEYVVLMGDVDDNGFVQNADVGALLRNISFMPVSDDNRLDVDGNGFVQNSDAGAVFPRISFLPPPPKPAGH